MDFRPPTAPVRPAFVRQSTPRIMHPGGARREVCLFRLYHAIATRRGGLANVRRTNSWPAVLAELESPAAAAAAAALAAANAASGSASGSGSSSGSGNVNSAFAAPSAAEADHVMLQTQHLYILLLLPYERRCVFSSRRGAL